MRPQRRQMTFLPVSGTTSFNESAPERDGHFVTQNRVSFVPKLQKDYTQPYWASTSILYQRVFVSIGTMKRGYFLGYNFRMENDTCLLDALQDGWSTCHVLCHCSECLSFFATKLPFLIPVVGLTEDANIHRVHKETCSQPQDTARVRRVWFMGPTDQTMMTYCFEE